MVQKPQSGELPRPPSSFTTRPAARAQDWVASSSEWYNSHIRCASASMLGRASASESPRRGIGFEEALELFSKPYWLDQRSAVPEQYLAVGWVGDRLHSVILEFR